MKTLFLAVSAIVIIQAVNAQSWKEDSADEIFRQARSRAFDGRREEAREMLTFALERSPDYHDLRILLARTYAWDGKRDEARSQLNYVLGKDAQNEDALNALTDVELWDERYQDLLLLTNSALNQYPNDEGFLYKKAVAQQELGQSDEAVLTINRLLTINPSHKLAASLLNEVKAAKLRYTVGASYSLDLFNKTFDPAHYASVQVGRTNSWGSSIVRLNYANRFKLNGLQTEVDLYPKIANGVYAYLNYGYSSTDLFPKHRIGAEVFLKLPASLEASAGLRYLDFAPGSKVAIYTGSLGWYVKSYWLSLRPYITPDKRTSTSFSASLTARKYFTNRDHYFGVSVGMGYSPDERRFQTTAGLSGDGIYLLKSQRGGIAWSKEMRGNFIVTASAEITHQEVIFDVGDYVIVTSLSVGLRKRL